MSKRGNNEGSIRFRADRGVYEARYTDLDGKQRSVYGKTRAEANLKLNEALRKLARGVPAHLDERMRLDAYLADWLTRIAPTIRASTHRRYAELLHHTYASLGRLPLVKLQPAHLDRLYVTLQQQPPTPDGRALSSSTVRRVHSVLHKALADAVRQGLLDRNVADLARPPRNREYEPVLWTMAQARHFLHAARDDRLGPLYVLAATTGMRLGELCGLRWSDVDIESAALHVRVALDRYGRVAETKTRASRRQIELPALALSALRLQRHYQAEEQARLGAAWQGAGSDLVFTSVIGTPLDGSNTLKYFRRFVRDAGLPLIRLHDLRHLQASLLLAGGLHPKVVQERLGHSKTSITMDTYSHLMPTLQREAAEVLDKLLGDWDDDGW